MKLKKFAFIMALVLCLASISSVYAEDFNEHSVKKSVGYETRWTNVGRAVTSVEESGSKIKASAEIFSRNNAKVSGRLYLQKYKNGYWSSVKSWKVKGKGLVKLLKKYSGGAGKYRTKLSIRVGGEDITVYSSSEYID